MKLNTLMKLLVTMFLMVSTQLTVAHAKESDLQKAFLKEYAFLETQKRHLMEQIKEFEKQSKNDRRIESQQVTSLEKDLRYSEIEADMLTEESVLLRHRVETTKDNESLVAATIEQSKASLMDNGVQPVSEVTEGISDTDILSKNFQLATRLVDNQSKVRIEKGAYFTKQGKRVEADILLVGRVAAYGLDEGNSGVLIPAGAGKLKLMQDDTSAEGRIIDSLKSDLNIPLFIYESLTKSVDQKKSKSVIGVVNSGGVIGWIIVVLGLFSLVLIVLRSTFLRNASLSTDVIQNDVGSLVAKGEINKAMALCESKRGSSARVVAATLRNIDRDRDHIEDIVSESILHESRFLNRFGAMIMVVAGVSPLLGLLGTVTGMIATFEVITEFGTGDPKLLSAGISTALVTTELGLVVAIPALIMGNLLTGWSNRIKDEIEKAALRVINLSKSQTTKEVMKAA